jgi:hypothetical protein
MAIQSAEAQASTLAKLAPPHTGLAPKNETTGEETKSMEWRK